MVIYIIDELCPYGVRSFTKVVTLEPRYDVLIPPTAGEIIEIIIMLFFIIPFPKYFYLSEVVHLTVVRQRGRLISDGCVLCRSVN